MGQVYPAGSLTKALHIRLTDEEKDDLVFLTRVLNRNQADAIRELIRQNAERARRKIQAVCQVPMAESGG